MSSKEKTLESGFTAEFDSVDAGAWYEVLGRFLDSNIYQTWSYDAVRCGEGNISHFVLRHHGEVVAAAQARLVRVPLLGLGAAYVRWGPLWQVRDREEDRVVFQNAVRVLRNEYVCRRRLVLRILPLLFAEKDGWCLDILKEEGYEAKDEGKSQRTLLLDINLPLEKVRKNFEQKWRNCLNRAERNELEVVEGTEDELFREFIGIYREMLDRKKFLEPNDIKEFRAIQERLPEGFKMGLFLCRGNGVASSGAIFSAIGDMGVYLFGATNDQGMKDKGSYLAQWKAIRWMQGKGCKHYNLNGINPTANPGSFHFKAGVAGKVGEDLHYVGRFESYPGAVSAALAQAADSALPLLKRSSSFFRSSGKKSSGSN